MHSMRFRSLAPLLIVFGLLAPCAGFAADEAAAPARDEAPAHEDAGIVSPRDPWEKYNRFMFRTNRAVDRAVLKPLAKGYKAITPEIIRTSISSALRNTLEPWTLVNTILQGKGDASFRTFGRFLINTTVGLGGLINVSQRWGIENDREDFGQTLAVWGVPSGPYLMLPGFGPSNPRDTLGVLAHIFGEPVGITLSRAVSTYADLGLSFAQVFDQRVQLLGVGDAVIDNSADPYVTLRSAWMQKRRFDILDGKEIGGPADDPFEGQPADPAPDQPNADQPQPQAHNTVDKATDKAMAQCLARDCTLPQIEAAVAAAREGASPAAAVATVLAQ